MIRVSSVLQMYIYIWIISFIKIVIYSFIEQHVYVTLPVDVKTRQHN